MSIDSFVYYGTDDLYLSNLARFVKPNGRIGIAGARLVREIENTVPDHLQEWWTNDVWCLHSANWWRRHWERTNIVEIEIADTMPDGWQLWRDWQKMITPDNEVEIRAIEADKGQTLSYIRLVGHRRIETDLEDPIKSLPAQYMKKSLLRG